MTELDKRHILGLAFVGVCVSFIFLVPDVSRKIVMSNPSEFPSLYKMYEHETPSELFVNPSKSLMSLEHKEALELIKGISYESHKVAFLMVPLGSIAVAISKLFSKTINAWFPKKELTPNDCRV